MARRGRGDAGGHRDALRPRADLPLRARTPRARARRLSRQRQSWRPALARRRVALARGARRDRAGEGADDHEPGEAPRERDRAPGGADPRSGRGDARSAPRPHHGTLMTHRIDGALRELAETALRTAETIGPDVEKALAMVRAAVQRGGTLYFCGNGGSAADAQHLATEYVVRYMKDRRAYPAVALTTDSSLLTATGNDLGFEHVFARQVDALAKADDLLIIHSTSGNSPNVLRAAQAA